MHIASYKTTFPGNLERSRCPADAWRTLRRGHDSIAILSARVGNVQKRRAEPNRAGDMLQGETTNSQLSMTTAFKILLSFQGMDCRERDASKGRDHGKTDAKDKDANNDKQKFCQVN